MSNAIGTTRRAFLAGLLLASAATTAQAQRALQFPPVQSVTAQHGMVVAQESRAALHRRRGAQARRQRGRCRGRRRLRHGGDLSARRQSRRRRLHADPSRQQASATSPSTIARPRRPRPRKRYLPRCAGRGRSGEVARPRSRHRRAGHRRRADDGAAEIRLGQVHACRSSSRRRSSSPATAIKVGDEFADTGRSSIARMARWPSTAKTFLKPDGVADRARHAAGAGRSRRHA